MKAYCNTIIFLLLLSQIVLQIAKESSKKELRLLCGLVLLTAVLSPLGMDVDLGAMLWEEGSALLEPEPVEITEEDDYRMLALSVMQYLRENYGVQEEGLECVVVTDEEGTVTELQIFVPACPYALRARIEKEMETMFGLEVGIYGE